MHETRFSVIASCPIRRNRLSAVLRTAPVAGILFLAALPATALGQSLTTNATILNNPIVVTQPTLRQITPTRTLNTTALRPLAPSAARIAPALTPGTNPVIRPNGVAPSVTATGLGRLVAPGAENATAVVARIGATTHTDMPNLTVDFDGDGLINFEIAPGIVEIPTDAAAGGGDALGGLVGQHITMATGTADRVLDGVINIAGVNPATTFEIANGTVVLGGFQPPDLAGVVDTPHGPATREPDGTAGRDPGGQTRPQGEEPGGGLVVVGTGPITEYCTGRGCVPVDPPKPEPGAGPDLSDVFDFTGIRRLPRPEPTQDLDIDDLVNVSIMLPLRSREREGDQFSNYGNEEIW